MTNLEQARDGDHRAFGALLRDEDDGCRALAYRILRDRDAMDDALQDAYLKAWRRLDSFHGDRGFGTWLYRIVYTTCIDQVRRRRPADPLDERTAALHAVGPAGIAEARITLDRALAEVSVEHRALLVLIDGIGLPYAEAARVLDLPEGTVASRLHHAVPPCAGRSAPTPTPPPTTNEGGPMTTPHDDDLRSALLDAPDHRPDFWTALDADLSAEEREHVVPLAAAGVTRSRGRGLLLAAAVLAVLGGIGAWIAFAGDDDGPDVAVDPEPSVPTAPDPTTPPPTVGETLPPHAPEFVVATVERTSEAGLAGTFTLTATEDGTLIVRGEETELAYHAPSGTTSSRNGDVSANEIDPIHGRSRLESLLMLDLADAVRYGGLGTGSDRDGRLTIEATADLADNESAGWFDRTATVVIDDITGLVLEATIADADGGVAESLLLTDLQWGGRSADRSTSIGVAPPGVPDAVWTVAEGLPAEPVVGDRYLVPESIEPVRTFTTDQLVESGSEAGNPEANGAYVIDVTTAPWRHSKIVVLGRTDGEWQDPLAEEGWFTEPTQVKTTGVLAGPGLFVTATPPVRPRVWSDVLPSEIVAIEGLIDPATARRLVNLTAVGPGTDGGRPAGPAVTTAPDGAESAFRIENVDGGGLVVARRAEGGAAAEATWRRAVDEIWWEPERGGIRPWFPQRMLDTGDAHAVVLLDAFADDDGEVAVIYGEVPSPGELDGAETNVWLQRFGQPHSEAVELGWFAGIEHGVDAASRGGDRIAVSAGADLGEVFTFYDLAGNEIEEPNNPVPVGHRYSEPPYYQHVALAPDGRTLAFVEGPDWDRTTQATVGDHMLVVVDLETGDETARIDLFGGPETLTEVGFLDFDGTWAVVSRQARQSPNEDLFALPSALAVHVDDGTVTELAGTTGVVTLVGAA